ncbi:hypothetical protein CLI64_14800 [Nostoc sp. CENA543]|uniref:DUF6745 domain-containing protein n=1 Tax=Nostoc sp. CENA543 TaxID=1869241 RepID=UPI000CA39370|nr:hypothetical protein [Nostoc sp. CENA543]AUT01555.1 hypothetical protein CLI64_14800 [Nostoc sp. CENA543]
MINKLTPEQKALIPSYLDKWRKIVLASELISQNTASEIVDVLYSFLGKNIPKIILLNNPLAAINQILLISSKEKGLENNFADDLERYIEKQLKEFSRQTSLISVGSILLDNRVNLESLENLEDQLDSIPGNNLNLLQMILRMNQSELVWQLWSKGVDHKAISSFDLYYTAALFDFFISECDCYYKPKIYQLLEQVVRAGIIIFPFEEYCFVCDRPLHLRLDNQNRLHAEGEPAIEFTDGYSLYFHHGVALPEEYGKLHPREWQPEWLLTQDNAELRRVLIQGIGYTRICAELQAKELDSWKEYTFLQIDNPIDVEPICLLKMTCPSTGFIHVLRVPPDTNSAREAVRWVNWGIDPEDFAVQT